MSAQIIPERCRSEESTPEGKKGGVALMKRGGEKFLRNAKGYKKLIRRRTSPGFFHRDSPNAAGMEILPSALE